MKIRNGFVSNSSSSSFIIAFNGDEVALKKKLEKVLKIPKKYPIKMKEPKDLAELFINCIIENCSLTTEEAYREEHMCQEVEDDRLCDEDLEAIKLLRKGCIVYHGGFSNQEDALENFLCESEIYYKDEEIFIYQPGGY